MKLRMHQSLTFSARWPWARSRPLFGGRMLGRALRGARHHTEIAFGNTIVAPGVSARRLPGVMKRYVGPAVLAGMVMAAGALLRYLFDPLAGLNRRQHVTGTVRRTGRRFGHRLGSRAADIRHRMRGVMVERWPMRAEVPDDVVLESRVMAELGHAVRHPDVDVSAHHGHVVLSGHAAVDEAERLLKRARRTRGVTDVESRIEITPI